MKQFEGVGWRGMTGEDEMTDKDVITRAGQQARAMLQAGDPFLSSPDAEGTPTGGCYNMDYPQSYHDKLNGELENNEYAEAQIDSDLREIQRLSDGAQDLSN